MKYFLALALSLAALLPLAGQTVPAKFTQRGDGYHMGTSPQQQMAMHGATPVAQRASLNQAYAGAATGTITFTGQPAAADTVTLGTGTYTFTGTLSAANQVLLGANADATLSNLVNAVMAQSIAHGVGNGASGSGTLFGSGTVANTAAYAGVGATVAASGTLTNTNTNPSAGDTTAIGGVTYRYESTLAQVNDIKIGGSADATMLSLAKTINGTGTAGTDNFTGTTANPLVSSTGSVTSHTIVLTALTAGASGNTIATTNPVGSTLSFGATTLSSGTSAVNLVAIAAGTAGNSVVLTKSSSALTVSGSGTLAGGTASPSAAQTAVLVNELRDALVQKGVIKGSN